jgi:threonine dehydratase
MPATHRQLQGAGRLVRVSLPSTPTRARGVIAYSSGNHAQGVALAAAAPRRPCVILMPSDAPQVKIANTRAYGAEVVLYDRATEDRDAIGARLTAERGLTLIKPYDDAQVIAGQGTTGLEIAAQAAEAGIDTATVIVCCGGGGLTAGIALALEARAPGLTVRTAEPAGFDDGPLPRLWAHRTQRRHDRLDLRRDPHPRPRHPDLPDPAPPLRPGPHRHG